MFGRLFTFVVLLPISAWACQMNPVTFEFTHLGSTRTYFAQATDPVVIETARQELSRPMGDRELIINGKLAAGDGGHNLPWRWHFVPNEWELTKTAIELCDGQPSDIDQDPEYWIDSVGRYCPWNSRILREL